jgi:transcriptional regulator with XRE-family HTH domain
MSDLTAKEQRAVRTTLRFLRLRMGAWQPLAKALHIEEDSISKVANGKRGVTASLALRVARFLEINVDALLAGQYLSPRVCPHCGHPPDDFHDEETIVEDS